MTPNPDPDQPPVVPEVSNQNNTPLSGDLTQGLLGRKIVLEALKGIYGYGLPAERNVTFGMNASKPVMSPVNLTGVQMNPSV